MHRQLICAGMLLVAALLHADDPLEQELKELARSPACYEVAGKWFQAAKKITDAELKQEVLKAAAAGAIYGRKEDIYVKRIRSLIQNPEGFESEFFATCPECGGAGMQDRPCQTCKGSGRCANPRCRGGNVVFHRISGDVWSVCSQCNASGHCQKCGGKKSFRTKCNRCGGTKRVANKDLLLASYRKHVDAAAKWKQELERRERERKEAEEKAKAEAERRERERKEAEAKAKAEAERRERERKEAEEKAKHEREERERRQAEIRKEQERIRLEMEALGLVNVKGKWMTPGSVRSVRYIVFQIYEPGHALCKDRTGRVFCLLYSAEDNQNLSEGDILVNDLYRCGTYSYITVNDAPSTVAKFAIDLPVAQREIQRQNQSRYR